MANKKPDASAENPEEEAIEAPDTGATKKTKIHVKESEEPVAPVEATSTDEEVLVLEPEIEPEKTVAAEKTEVAEDISTGDELAEATENTESEETIGQALDAAAADEAVDLLPDDTKQKDDLDAMVDDIVMEESNEQIANDDEKLAAAEEPKKKSGLKQKLKRGFLIWWHTAWLRNTSIGLLVVILALLALVPVTRYTILNLAGVRVQSSMTVIDSQTRLPLKNIQVALQDKTADTDKQGRVYFEDLKLGKSKLAITKRGYADSIRDTTLGWGSNPIGDQEITATGEQFTFILTDWLSDERIKNAEATAGESSANSDDDGKIILTIDQKSIGESSAIVSAEGYRDEEVQQSELVEGDINVVMVPDTRHPFVSNRNGKFDVYLIDLDGKNEELLVAATEKEREVPGILQHPTKNKFALVSSRDGVKNSDNYVLDGLFVVDAASGEIENVGRSERVQLLGWSDDSLVYTQVIEGTSRENPERSKLYSFSDQRKEKIELAAANYFNDIELVGDTVTYAVSSFAVPQSRAKLYSIAVDGKEKRQLLDLQVYTIFRSSQTTLLYNAVDQKWFSQKDKDDLQETDQVVSPKSRQYIASPDGSRVVWTETRDGKGVLFLSDSAGENQQEVLAVAGIESVEYWANNETIVFRSIKSEETADYVVNLKSPEEARKIADVTASKRAFF